MCILIDFDKCIVIYLPPQCHTEKSYYSKIFPYILFVVTLHLLPPGNPDLFSVSVALPFLEWNEPIGSLWDFVSFT